MEREHGAGIARAAARWATRVVFPDVCAGCGVTGAWMCRECTADCSVIDLASCCPRCGYPAGAALTACRRCAAWPPALAHARSVYHFDGPVRRAIHRLKYEGEYARAEWGGAELAAHVGRVEWRADLLLPVPLHPRRQRERGYNHADKLARQVARHTGMAVDATALRRIRATPQQVGLGAAERARNVAGAFEATRPLRGHTVLLVDDVLTTGATLLDCARACIEAGAADVRALTLASGS